METGHGSQSKATAMYNQTPVAFSKAARGRAYRGLNVQWSKVVSGPSTPNQHLVSSWLPKTMLIIKREHPHLYSWDYPATQNGLAQYVQPTPRSSATRSPRCTQGVHKVISAIQLCPTGFDSDGSHGARRDATCQSDHPLPWSLTGGSGVGVCLFSWGLLVLLPQPRMCFAFFVVNTFKGSCVKTTHSDGSTILRQGVSK